MNATAEDGMTGTVTNIRDAAPADIPRLLELYYQLSEQSRTAEATVREATDAHDTTVQRITDDPNTHVLVMEQDGYVIGTYTLYVLPNLSHGGRHLAIVENVVVDASLRGSGHGRALMDDAVRRAKAAGCYKLSLTSHNNRAPAHAFYARIGFTNSHKGFTQYFD